MSKREDITCNIIDCLQNADNPRFGLVTRKNFDINQLSRQQYPAIYVVTADEERNDITMTGSNGRRQAELEIVLIAWVNGTNIDELRNDVIERIEEALAVDTSRGGSAKRTQVRNIAVDYDIVEPYGRVDVTVLVEYDYTRGNT